MDIHPAAAAFPMMSEVELEAMAEDIKSNGLRSPIVVWRGRVVDGRNRLAALAKTVTPPRFVELEGYDDEGDVIRWIISTNIHRRHLSTEQRAMIASDLAKLGLGANQHGREGAGIQAPSLSQAQAAEAMQVSRDSVQKAKAIATADPALAAEVKAGNRSLNSAHREIKRRTAPAKPVATLPDPDQADDAVIDAKEESDASGYTKQMEKIWAGFIALSATEQTAYGERYKGWLRINT